LVWKTALPIIKNHFFFGVGFGNYKLVSGFYGENPSIGANNMFLQILSENGIFGLIFFLLMLAVFLVSINKKLKISKDKILYLAVVFAVVTVLLYNFFVFSIWTATDILLLFFLLSFSIEKYGFTNRNKKINFYILLSLLSPLTIISGMPFYAEQKYEKAMSSLAGQNRQSAELELFNALRGDGLNSKYFNALSDIYLQHYQDSKQKEYLDFAVNLSENALKLNKYNDKYYYQLAWLYYFKGDKNLALKNIEEALKIEGDNSLYKQTRETIKAF
jgi:tetratricopeptide (TPR) repeat protein